MSDKTINTVHGFCRTGRVCVDHRGVGMRSIVAMLETDLLSLLGPDGRLQVDFFGLADHIGIDPKEALMDALNHWVGQNAELFDYPYGTDLTPTKENNTCPTPKN